MITPDVFPHLLGGIRSQIVRMDLHVMNNTILLADINGKTCCAEEALEVKKHGTTQKNHYFVVDPTRAVVEVSKRSLLSWTNVTSHVYLYFYEKACT
jgi:hypothetical protein